MLRNIIRLLLVTTMFLCAYQRPHTPSNTYGRAHKAVQMMASWYGSHWTGRLTASGARFNHQALTCAHKTLPFGTVLRLEYQGRQVKVRVTDRGPYIKGRDLDLSWAAAKALGMIDTGVARVRVLRAIAPTSLNS